MTIHLKLDANKEWWYRQHEEVRSSGSSALLLAGGEQDIRGVFGKGKEKKVKLNFD